MIYTVKKEIVYSVEHFYPKHPGHPIAAGIAIDRKP